jgi:hypothetical protein
MIEKSTKLCENLGMAFVDLGIDKGKYKLYYMRIENEQRILSNSRIEVLGCSKPFSVNQMNSDVPEKEGVQKDHRIEYEESYSYSNQGSVQKRKFGSPDSIA